MMDDQSRELLDRVRAVVEERDALRDAVREVLDEPHAYIGGRERALLTAALQPTRGAR